MALYRGMDRSELDAAYNNRQAVPAYEAIAARRRRLSDQIRATRRFHADLRYGTSARERLHFSILDELAAPGGVLCGRLVERAGRLSR